MTEKDIATKHAKLEGFNKIYELRKQLKSDPMYDHKYEGCSFFIASEHSDDENLISMYVVKNSNVRSVDSLEEFDHIMEIAAPLCV